MIQTFVLPKFSLEKSLRLYRKQLFLEVANRYFWIMYGLVLDRFCNRKLAEFLFCHAIFLSEGTKFGNEFKNLGRDNVFA